ncbi:hypothetical protein [Rhodovibrio sodomensis]|uniref:hypothetical protein n=1 Tax=Rhodovibrio sodomensis TaxID=1088 RepID=UPI0019076D5F|nr:hypothetical protein [Rhodovibrio sodomensis]
MRKLLRAFDTSAGNRALTIAAALGLASVAPGFNANAAGQLSINGRGQDCDVAGIPMPEAEISAARL